MKKTQILCLVALMASACGSTADTASHASPTPVPSASAEATSPTPTSTALSTPASSPISSGASFSVLPRKQPAGFVSTITCSGSIGASDPVAVVQLRGASGGDAVLRDYANTSSPRTACVFKNGQVRQLIDARHVIIAPQIDRGDAAYAYAVVDLPEVRYHWFQLPHPPGFGAGLIAVSPALNEIAWFSNNDRTGGDRKVHLTTKSGDKVVGNLPIALGRCGSSEASKEGAYTNSASHLYVLDQPLPDNTLLVFQGAKQVLAVRPPGAGWPKGVASQPMMAVWSPTTQTLFYRQNGSVLQWTQAGGKQLYLKGISWYYPTFSPDGSHLAYSVLRSDGLHNTYVVDVAHGGSPKLIGKGPRNLPVFLNSTQIFYWSEGNGICGPGVNQRLVYDITDGSESSTVIDGVSHIWPATSSQF